MLVFIPINLFCVEYLSITFLAAYLCFKQGMHGHVTITCLMPEFIQYARNSEFNNRFFRSALPSLLRQGAPETFCMARGAIPGDQAFSKRKIKRNT